MGGQETFDEVLGGGAQGERALLRALLSHAPVVLFAVDADGIVRLAEGRGLLAVGRAPSDLVGKSIHVIYQELPALRENVMRALTGETFRTEIRLTGSAWDAHYACVRDAAGAITGAAVVATDISELIRVEERARQTLWFLDSIVENIPDMIFVKDAADLRFVRVNRAGEELIGVRQRDLVGKNDYDMFPLSEAEFFTRVDREVLTKGEMLEIPEEPIHTQDGGKRILHTKKIPIRDERGVPRYLLGISEDITRRKEIEEQHQRLYDKLQELDRLKADFVANVSHELRTPLTLVLGLTERLLREGPLNQAQRRDLASVMGNADILLKQVNDLLDISKLEAAKVTLQTSRVDLGELLRTTAAAFEVVATQRNCSLVLEIPSEVIAEVDAEKVQRILSNLLSNAFKFIPQGGRVRCSLLARDERASIVVADSGAGIPAALRDKIFERFFQVDGGPHRREGGTGLGLTIVKELVDLHGGNISVDEADEGGARFLVELPLQGLGRATSSEVLPAPSAAAPATTAPLVDPAMVPPAIPPRTIAASGVAPAPSSVELTLDVPDLATPSPETALPALPALLVVEDNLEMNRFIVETLQREYRVTSAFDGAAALAAALASPPDIILTDVMMPQMSGDMLVRALRSHAELDGVPIVLLTARADDKLRVAMLREGAQDYVVKPFSAEELKARLHNLVTMRTARQLLQRELTSRTDDLGDLATALSQRKRDLESALEVTRVAREQAERASHLKSTFLALVSHELRTPMTTLKLRLQSLRRVVERPADDVPAPRLEFGQVVSMVSAAERLYQLVDSILNYSQVESGRLPLEIESFDVTSLVADVTRELRPQALHKGVSLQLRPPPVEFPALASDRRLVRVVVQNLVSNAVRFTHSGSVEVELSPHSAHCEIAVIDTGPGIPLEHQARIFEPFELLEPIANKHIPGAGIGLALVRELVKALGGSVELESEMGRGSTFRALFPWRARSLADAHALEERRPS